MNAHASPSQPGNLLVLSDPGYPIRAFLRRYQAELIKGVASVAGPKEAQRASVLAYRLRVVPEIKEEDIEALVRLHRLLSLDVDLEDPRWMHLHPASEEVIEVCLVTDELAGLLKQCEDCRWWADNWAGRRPRRAGTARAA